MKTNDWIKWMKENLKSKFWDWRDARWDYASECADMVEEHYETEEQIKKWLKEQDENRLKYWDKEKE